MLETDDLDLAVGEERDGICQSWTLDNDEWLFVNAVEVSTGGSFRHSNSTPRAKRSRPRSK